MGLFQRLALRILNRHDPAAVMQTPVVKFSGYDEAKAVAGWKRSQAHSETGRRLPKPKAAKPASVVPFRKAGSR